MSPPTSLIGADARAMRRELAGAPDAQLLQVLRYVEALPERGEADALVAPVRDRLRELKPARPLTLRRLLFLPLDPVMVDAGAWRPGMAAVPRHAALPVATFVRACAAAESSTVEATIKGRFTSEIGVVLTAGSVLWPAAAGVLAMAAGALPAWEAAGLRAPDFVPLASALAFVLGEALAIADLLDPGLQGAEREPEIDRLLDRAAGRGPLAWGLLFSILTARLPESPALRRLVATPPQERALRQAADEVIGLALTAMEQPEGGRAHTFLADESRLATRQIALLDALMDNPAHRRRAVAAQANLRRNLQERMENSVRHRLAPALRALPADAEEQAAVVAVLEQEARAVRKLETELRRLGGTCPDPALRAAADLVATTPALHGMDKARLIEILAGPGAARALLDAL